MKIVLDTNVLISAFIATGPSKDVFEYVIENHDVILSPYIFQELGEKLIGKLGFSYQEYREIKGLLKDSVHIIKEKKASALTFSDPKDLPILELCISV
ncbi:MAG TPA: putative toxin-antitoxin system toxin component, PIN family, partial [Nitrospirae bacterium]|nr:putative toxin-antitoxin system toxin component, PIN family [Nitrospirota bacterium]